jgi:hypothetical protein
MTMSKSRKKKTSAGLVTVRFTVTCTSNDSLSGMIQTEDQVEKEKRLLIGDSGTAEVGLAEGTYTFVWAVKMTPVQRHRYGITAERIPGDGGDPVELRKRPNEQTTTGGEDVGFDDFTL